MALSFFFWNARSLIRKTQELHTFLRDSLPSVVGVCETWLPSHLSLHFQGYSMYRQDRQQRRGGGVLLAVREELVHSQLPIPPRSDNHLEVVAVRVGLWEGWITVAVCYNPGGAAPKQEFDQLFSSLPSPALIMGDFNALHPYWDHKLKPQQKTTAGSALFRALEDSPPYVSAQPTRFGHTVSPQHWNLLCPGLFLG